MLFKQHMAIYNHISENEMSCDAWLIIMNKSGLDNEANHIHSLCYVSPIVT